MARGLSDAQRRVLDALRPVVPADAYLGGGAGLAARYAHRSSADLDVFTSTTDPVQRVDALAALPGCHVTSAASRTVYLELDGIPVSLLHYRYPLLREGERIGGVALPVASVVDAACMKIAAIAQRGLARDFWDVEEILEREGLELGALLDAFTEKYPAQDLGHIVRSLVYFGDAETVTLPADLDRKRWVEIQARLTERVRALE